MAKFYSLIACTLITCSFAFKATAEGTLTVKTDPEGIEVWLDDKFAGDSPILEKKLKPGRYTLKLVDPIQHTSTTEDVFIQEGENTVIEKTLKSKFGVLRVNSEPEGANVFISSELGKTPLSNEFMNPGKYRLEIVSPNKKYKSLVQDITIPRGEAITINKKLESSKSFKTKDMIRLGLGVIAIGAYSWAIIEQGNQVRYDKQADFSPIDRDENEKKARKSGLFRTLGFIGGTASVIGIEIISFF